MKQYLCENNKIRISIIMTTSNVFEKNEVH
jgi:hypothetical protein